MQRSGRSTSMQTSTSVHNCTSRVQLYRVPSGDALTEDAWPIDRHEAALLYCGRTPTVEARLSQPFPAQATSGAPGDVACGGALGVPLALAQQGGLRHRVLWPLRRRPPHHRAGGDQVSASGLEREASATLAAEAGSVWDRRRHRRRHLYWGRRRRQWQRGYAARRRGNTAGVRGGS